jgi:hypothetical protein
MPSAIVAGRQDKSYRITFPIKPMAGPGAAVASLARLPHAKFHRVLTEEDDHGDLCRASEVH